MHKPFAPRVFQRGYVGINTPDLARALDYYGETVGMTETDRGDGTSYLSIGYDHHNILLRALGVKVEWGPARHTAGHNLGGYHFDPDRVLIELYTDMDVYIPELDMCEARPWHEHYPMRPRNWKMTELSAWGTDFDFNLAQA